MNKPTKETKLSRKCGSIRVVNRHWSLSDNDGSDMTQDGYYCLYINDLLKCIRGKCGKNELVQTARHIYQIGELLRFEPLLKSKLVHEYNDTYFEVWLDDNINETY